MQSSRISYFLLRLKNIDGCALREYDVEDSTEYAKSTVRILIAMDVALLSSITEMADVRTVSDRRPSNTRVRDLVRTVLRCPGVSTGVVSTWHFAIPGSMRHGLSYGMGMKPPQYNLRELIGRERNGIQSMCAVLQSLIGFWMTEKCGTSPSLMRAVPLYFVQPRFDRGEIGGFDVAISTEAKFFWTQELTYIWSTLLRSRVPVKTPGEIYPCSVYQTRWMPTPETPDGAPYEMKLMSWLLEGAFPARVDESGGIIKVHRHASLERALNGTSGASLLHLKSELRKEANEMGLPSSWPRDIGYYGDIPFGMTRYERSGTLKAIELARLPTIKEELSGLDSIPQRQSLVLELEDISSDEEGAFSPRRDCPEDESSRLKRKWDLTPEELTAVSPKRDRPEEKEHKREAEDESSRLKRKWDLTPEELTAVSPKRDRPEEKEQKLFPESPESPAPETHLEPSDSDTDDASETRLGSPLFHLSSEDSSDEDESSGDWEDAVETPAPLPPRAPSRAPSPWAGRLRSRAPKN